MTSEIAIINNSAVALATDSAVTIQRDGESKVYNSVNKLFTLSKFEPVGIMIYGDSGFLTLAWETLIKEFRTQLGRDGFDTLEEYADAFFAFLKDPDRSRIGLDFQEKVFWEKVTGLLQDLRQFVYRELEGQGGLVDGQPIPEDLAGSVETTCKAVFDEVFKRSQVIPEFEGWHDEFLEEFGANVDALAAEIIPCKKWTKQGQEVIREMVFHLGCTDYASIHHSGLVIAGFGRKEMVPELRSYIVDGMVKGKLKVIPRDRSSQSSGHPNIFSFAQSEDSLTFLFGMDPRLQALLSGIIDQAGNLPMELLDGVTGVGDEDLENVKQQVSALAPPVAKLMKERVERFQQEEHLGPVSRVLASLPKDEMAEMAEALVHLSYIKRRFSMTLESVGGPIDVAVISRGDGFIWIKRKHYFDAALNPHFINNYAVERSEASHDPGSTEPRQDSEP